MTTITKIVGMTALGLGIVASIPVFGHGFGGGMHGPYGGGWGPENHMMYSGDRPCGQAYGANVEQRLGSLKESLNLTADQQPAWDQYEQAVKTMVENRPAGGPHWNDSGDADTHFAQMEQHFTQMKAVFEARKALYDTLTDQQKETINNYMPGPYGHHLGYNG